MKKAASALTALVMAASFQATCSAMQFQQPVFLGTICGIYAGGPHPAHLWKISKEVSVKKNVMIMGQGKTALYFKYKDTAYSNDKYKYRNITDIVSGSGNVFPRDIPDERANYHFTPNHSIYQVNGENGIVAYIDIGMAGGADDADSLTIRGLWKDGKAVTFVNTNSTNQYKNRGEGFFFDRGKITVKSDTICVPFVLKKGDFNNQLVSKGEFRFKWDDKAQWFGVEQIVYSPSSDPVNIKAQQELASYGIQETVKSTTFGSNSNGFLVRTANDVFAVDRKNHQVAKIEIANLLSSMKAGKSSGLSVLIFNDTHDEDNNYGEWRGQNHFIPILLLDKYDASSNKYNSPYMYTGPGANPYRMHGFLKEQKHKDLVLLLLKELFSHNDFDLSSL